MRSFNVRSPYKQVIKSVRFQQPSYLARTAWKASALKSSFVRVVTNAISLECKQLCRTSPSSSLLRTASVHKLLEFKWDAVLEELKTKAPTLLAILQAAGNRTASTVKWPAVVMAAAFSSWLWLRTYAFAISRDFITAILVFTLAVAVSAIRLVHFGTIDRISEMLSNSLWKSTPLEHVESNTLHYTIFFLLYGVLHLCKHFIQFTLSSSFSVYGSISKSAVSVHIQVEYSPFFHQMCLIHGKTNNIVLINW